MFAVVIPGNLITLVLASLVVSGCCYYVAVLIAAWRFRNRESFVAAPERPGVSILKPVRGADPDFLECIRSHAAQEYPEFEIIFGVSDPNDPAIGPIKQLIREFPHRRIELVICESHRGGNAKAASLEQIEPSARYDILLVSDSDVALPSDHLSKAIAELSEPNVGMVCSLYEARSGVALASNVEAAMITAEFQGQVLLAKMLQGIRFGLGAAMLFRRDDLRRIGGFQVLSPYVGDDYELGRRIGELGRRIVLSNSVVQTCLGAGSWRDVWRHQLRWSRTIRAARPAGHLGLLFTNGSVWSLLLIAAAGGFPAMTALSLVCLALRILAARQIAGRTLRSENVLRHTLLSVPGDLLAFAVWAASLFSRRVFWRGRWLRLGPHGRITEVDGNPVPQTQSPKASPAGE